MNTFIKGSESIICIIKYSKDSKLELVKVYHLFTRDSLITKGRISLNCVILYFLIFVRFEIVKHALLLSWAVLIGKRGGR